MRRGQGLGLALVAVVGAVAGSAAAVVARPVAATAVERENRRPGTTGWDLRGLPPGILDGYAGQVSVAPGDTLELHVSAASGIRYRVEVYRLGWYGGAGGRRVVCVPSCTDGRAGRRYPVPAVDPATGLLRAGWPVTDRVPVGSDWPSGYYVANLVVADRQRRRGSWVPFVVREASGRRAAILVQVPVNTWQAYNRWGGRSLYWNHTGVGDDHVSFDRPYAQWGAPRHAERRANLPQAWELPLVRFLEQGGYDVSYTTDVDVDRDPGSLLGRKLDISAGHDEYWTKTMRDAWERARDSGVNLAFMGANTAYWQMRYEDDRRTIVEYRTGDRDPEPSLALKTVRFRDLVPPRPECELLGVQSLAIGNADYQAVVGTPPDPWFARTGITDGSRFPGLVGYEYDTRIDGCRTPPLTDLFHASITGNPNADAVRYTARSGARVFSAGSIRFAVALDPSGPLRDPRLQRFVRNAFADLTR